MQVQMYGKNHTFTKKTVQFNVFLILGLFLTSFDQFLKLVLQLLRKT